MFICAHIHIYTHTCIYNIWKYVYIYIWENTKSEGTMNTKFRKPVAAGHKVWPLCMVSVSLGWWATSRTDPEGCL